MTAMSAEMKNLLATTKLLTPDQLRLVLEFSKFILANDSDIQLVGDWEDESITGGQNWMQIPVSVDMNKYKCVDIEPNMRTKTSARSSKPMQRTQPEEQSPVWETKDSDDFKGSRARLMKFKYKSVRLSKKASDSSGVTDSTNQD